MNREEKEVFRSLCNFEGTGPEHVTAEGKIGRAHV